MAATASVQPAPLPARSLPPPGLPAPPLDVQVQSFLSRVSPLVAAVEEQLRQDEPIVSAPSTRWLRAVDPASTRPFYFEHSRRVVSWHRPSAFDEMVGKTERQDARDDDLAMSPSTAEDEESTVAAAFERVSFALWSLKASLSDADEEGRLEWALLKREAAIRRDDWEEMEITNSYALAKSAQLLDRLRQLSSPPVATSAPALSPPTSSPSMAPEPASQPAPTSAVAVAPIPATAAPTFAPVRRPAISVSRPPSQPLPAPSSTSPTSATAPAAVNQPLAPEPSPARPLKVRKVEAAGAVGAMMAKWNQRKAREEQEREGEGERQLQVARGHEATRVQRLAAEVHREQQRKGSADNPNLIPIKDDWRRRLNPGADTT